MSDKTDDLSGCGILDEATIKSLIHSLANSKQKAGKGEFSRAELEKVIDWATETTLNATLLDCILNGEADINVVGDSVEFEKFFTNETTSPIN